MDPLPPFFFHTMLRVERIDTRLPGWWGVHPEEFDAITDETSKLEALFRFLVHLGSDIVDKKTNPAVISFFSVLQDIANQFERAEKGLRAIATK